LMCVIITNKYYWFMILNWKDFLNEFLRYRIDINDES
jgi:hypothetical protein